MVNQNLTFRKYDCFESDRYDYYFSIKNLRFWGTSIKFSEYYFTFISNYVLIYVNIRVIICLIAYNSLEFYKILCSEIILWSINTEKYFDLNIKSCSMKWQSSLSFTIEMCKSHIKSIQV